MGCAAVCVALCKRPCGHSAITSAERRGDEPIITAQLQLAAKQCPNALECNSAIHSALKKLTTGEAKQLIAYGVNGGGGGGGGGGGIDACRELYNECLPVGQT